MSPPLRQAAAPPAPPVTSPRLVLVLVRPRSQSPRCARPRRTPLHDRAVPPPSRRWGLPTISLRSWPGTCRAGPRLASRAAHRAGDQRHQRRRRRSVSPACSASLPAATLSHSRYRRARRQAPPLGRVRPSAGGMALRRRPLHPHARPGHERHRRSRLDGRLAGREVLRLIERQLSPPHRPPPPGPTGSRGHLRGTVATRTGVRSAPMAGSLPPSSTPRPRSAPTPSSPSST